MLNCTSRLTCASLLWYKRADIGCLYSSRISVLSLVKIKYSPKQANSSNQAEHGLYYYGISIVFACLDLLQPTCCLVWSLYQRTCLIVIIHKLSLRRAGENGSWSLTEKGIQPVINPTSSLIPKYPINATQRTKPTSFNGSKIDFVSFLLTPAKSEEADIEEKNGKRVLAKGNS